MEEKKMQSAPGAAPGMNTQQAPTGGAPGIGAYAYVPPAPEPKPVFSGKEQGFAVLCLVLGFFLIDTLLFSASMGLALSLYALCFLLACGLFLRIEGIGQTRSTLPALLMCTASALFFFLSSNDLLKLLNIPFFIVLSVYWLLTCGGLRLTGGFSCYTPSELANAGLRTAFSNFSLLPHAVKQLFTRSGKGKTLLLCLLGLLIAVPVTAIAVSLLMSADAAFEAVWRSLTGGFAQTLPSRIGECVLAIPVALYLFGLIYGCAKKHHTQALTKESAAHTRRACRIAPTPLLAAALTPLLVVYALYFVSQAAYFSNAFQRIFPEGFTYASFARRGFFELCLIATLNLGVLFLSWLLEKGAHPALRIMSALLSVFTLLFIAIDAAKMALYIHYYGLTPLRVYTSWFMALLFLIFAILLLARVRRSVNTGRALCICSLAMVFLLLFSNTDRLIVGYNVSRYLDGTLPGVDFSVFYESGDAALDLIEPLTRASDPVVAADAEAYLRDQAQEAQLRGAVLSEPNADYRSLTLPRLLSQGILKRYH